MFFSVGDPEINPQLDELRRRLMLYASFIKRSRVVAGDGQRKISCSFGGRSLFIPSGAPTLKLIHARYL